MRRMPIESRITRRNLTDYVTRRLTPGWYVVRTARRSQQANAIIDGILHGSH